MRKFFTLWFYIFTFTLAASCAMAQEQNAAPIADQLKAVEQQKERVRIEHERAQKMVEALDQLNQTQRTYEGLLRLERELQEKAKTEKK